MMSPAKIKSIAVALSLCALSLTPFQSSAGQKKTPARDTSALRRSFVEAFGEDFELLRDEVARRSTWHGGGLSGSPRNRSVASLQAQLQDGRDRVRRKTAYEFVSRIPVWAARGPAAEGSGQEYTDVCLGDTISVPVSSTTSPAHLRLTDRIQPRVRTARESLK